jgi:hypothetical protein
MVVFAHRRHLPCQSPQASARTSLFPRGVIFWYAHSMPLFFCSLNRPYTVSLISMGAFLSTLSSTWLISVHGARMLISSASPSVNCWYNTHLFATLPIFDTGTPFNRSSTSNSLLVSRATLLSSSFWCGRQWGVRPCALHGTQPNSSSLSPSLQPHESAY